MRPDDHILSFGRHAGQPLDKVPLPYLDWLLGQDWFSTKYPTDHRAVATYMSDPVIQRELDQQLGDDE